MESEPSEISIVKDHKPHGTSLANGRNKVRPENGRLKSTVVQEKWKSFVEASTLHGLHYIFTSATLFRRILWTLFLLAGMAWFTYQTSRLLTKFLSFPVATTVTMEYEDMPDFPAVSICNFNMFRESRAEAGGFIEVLRYVRYGTHENPINWTKFENANTTELFLSGGHQIDDVLLGCSWIEEYCTAANFTPVLTSMGLCYTFNSGKDGHPILKAIDAGTNFGLYLTLNIQQYDYYGPLTYKAGLKVLIHDHDTPPLVEQLGFSVAPGTTNFVAIRKQRVKNLPKPYKSRCFNGSVRNIPGYTKYTTSACRLSCKAEYVAKKCGCVAPEMPSNARTCGPREIVECVRKETLNFRISGSQHCDCPVPCETISYKTSLSYAAYPSNKHIESLVQYYSSLGFANNTPEYIEEQHKFVRENFLELYVFFQELNYQFVEQRPAYNYESLLGEIGGQVGLCVGASLLTVLEFCDVGFTLVGMRLGFR